MKTMKSLFLKQRKKYTVKLTTVGNPDFYQNPDLPMSGVPSGLAHVDTLTEARSLCRYFIDLFSVGGGNWSGGEVVRTADGSVVGNFSYNGRLWSDKNGKQEIIIND